MHYLSEDPWPLVAILGTVALGFLIALRVTQDGKYLIRAGIALGLAGLVFAVEQAWVTDSERIEAVVYDLVRAVRGSDAEGVIAQMAPEVAVVLGDNDLGTLGADQLRRALKDTRFDLLILDKLVAEAYSQSRTGKATFRTRVKGERQGQQFGVPSITWDFGFREAAPGAWKVTRISPTQLPMVAEFVLQRAMKR